MPANLFSEFDFSDKDSWKKQVQKELKGKEPSPEHWKIAKSVYLEPYYTASEVDETESEAVRNAQRKTTGWLNMPLIEFSNARETNTRMRSMLGSGANALLLDLGNRSLPECELTKTLHAIRLSDSHVYFDTRESPVALYNDVVKGAGYYLKGGFLTDPVATFMQTGKAIDTTLDEIARVIEHTKAMKDFRPFGIEGHQYHNAGADPVQELAFMISGLVKCADHLTDAGLSALEVMNRFLFSVSIGPEYLTEIAKLRALRLLYRKITHAYQLPDTACRAFIHTQTSDLHLAEPMPHTNMIRTTSEAMSAVVGGCNALTIKPYMQGGGELAERIATNVSLIIDNESFMGQVADPASGSYLIDKMSVELAESAWSLFLQMEERGGIIGCLENGFIQSEIQRSWEEKKDALLNGKVVVGVNKFGEVQSSLSLKHPKTELTTGFPKRNLSQTWNDQQEA